MTVRECYEKIGSDFDKVLGRMGSEALVKRFAVKFLEDKSFEELTESLKEKDGEDAFRAAHTLKGICANLGLDRLYEADSELTEKLRNSTTVDWQKRDSVRARLRNLVRITLRRYKYPPEMQEEAIRLVLDQAERLSDEWSRG